MVERPGTPQGAQLPHGRPTGSPGTPQGKSEGRGDRALAGALWGITDATRAVIDWANDNAPLVRFVGQWHGHVPMDPDPNPFPPIHLFRKDHR